MKMTKFTKTGLKRLWTWVIPEIHAEVKMNAAKEGIFMEEFVRKAILEYLKKVKGEDDE